jgi:hypothetical protein
VIALYVAAEILSKQNKKDSDLKLAAANARLAQLKAGLSDRRRVRVGMGSDGKNPRLDNEVLAYRSYSASN